MSQATLVARLQAGDHVCWTFDDDGVRDRVVVAFVSASVAAREKVMYLPHAAPAEEVLGRFAEAGVDGASLIATGRLEVITARDTYLSEGRFDAVAMVETVEAACGKARADGFAGLRIAGDASWAAGPVAGTHRLNWYEAQVGRIFAQGYATGLCLYDRRLFAASWLRAICVQHPGVVNPGAGDEWRPLLRVRDLPDAVGVRVDGETDLSNRGCWDATLGRLGGPGRRPRNRQPGEGTGPAAPEVPVLDVTRLHFADVAAARSIVLTAERIGGLRVIGASQQLRRLLALLTGDRCPELLVADAPPRSGPGLEADLNGGGHPGAGPTSH